MGVGAGQWLTPQRVTKITVSNVVDRNDGRSSA